MDACSVKTSPGSLHVASHLVSTGPDAAKFLSQKLGSVHSSTLSLSNKDKAPLNGVHVSFPQPTHYKQWTPLLLISSPSKITEP
jgi:hypothetical protein